MPPAPWVTGPIVPQPWYWSWTSAPGKYDSTLLSTAAPPILPLYNSASAASTTALPPLPVLSLSSDFTCRSSNAAASASGSGSGSGSSTSSATEALTTPTAGNAAAAPLASPSVASFSRSFSVNDTTCERRRWLSWRRASWSARRASKEALRRSKSRSSCLVFHRARRFWNHTATCRGCRPSLRASSVLRSGSSLFSSSKLLSSRCTCSGVRRRFFSGSCSS
uniref:Uncharacterized protein n=1 Tax=Zea mays TaxID=4577 RepID=C0PKV2_MAIZE|nr:unknown [Zea mays]